MPEHSQQQMHAEAEALLDRQDLTGARRLYARICENHPEDAEAWLMLGIIHIEDGQTDAALSALHTAVSHDPNLADAHFQIAGLLVNSGDMEQALTYCQRAIEIDPDYAEAWMLLGMIQGGMGLFGNAVTCFREALARDPGSAEAAANLGVALINSGQHEEASRVYSEAARLHPANSSLWTALGDTSRMLGKYTEAIRAYRRSLELDARNQRVLQSLAELYLEGGLPDKCVAVCNTLMAIEPDNAHALSALGTAHQLMGQLNEAVATLGRAAELQPDNATNHYKLACACQAVGELDRAMAHFDRTLELEAGSEMAISGLVRVHDQKGNRAEVERLLPALIEAADHNPLVLPSLASVAPKFGIENICLDKLLQTINRGNTPDALRSRLHWAAGMLNERIGNHDAAFEHHHRAKSLASGRYDAAAHSAFIDRIISVFTRTGLDAAPRSSQSSNLPVFIVGMPRSGTSLVEQILASHPQVFGAGELDTMARIAHELPPCFSISQRYPEYMRELTPEILDAAATGYLDQLMSLAADAVRATDKMPHNFLFLGLIQLLFPNARIIHLIRDPLDTCISCFFQEFSNAHAYTRNLSDLGAHYRDYERLMKHWRQVLRIPMLDLQYEELVAEPERMMHKLIEFSGLTWDAACADFFKADRVVATLSSSQVREPLNRKSIGKSRLYASHLAPLKLSLGMQHDQDSV